MHRFGGFSSWKAGAWSASSPRLIWRGRRATASESGKRSSRWSSRSRVRPSGDAPASGLSGLLGLIAFHEGAQSLDRMVPALRDLSEMPARLREALRLQLPDALTASALACHELGLGQGVQVLRDRLARDLCALRQPRDRERALLAEFPDDPQP